MHCSSSCASLLKSLPVFQVQVSLGINNLIYVFWKNSCIQWVREQWGIPMYRQSWCHHCALLPATTVTTILGQCCVSLRLFLNVTQSFHSGMISLGYLPEEITFFFHYEDFPSKNEKKNLMSESRRKLSNYYISMKYLPST